MSRSVNLYSQYRDEIEIIEEEEPDLSLFNIGMSHTPSYASSFAEEISIEQSFDTSAFKDEVSSVASRGGGAKDDDEQQVTLKKSRRKSSRRSNRNHSTSSATTSLCGRMCRFLKRNKYTISFLMLVVIGVIVAVTLAINKTNTIVASNAIINPRMPYYIEQSSVDPKTLKDVKSYLVELYQEHSLDPSVLDTTAGENAPRFAMFWMASDSHANFYKIDDYDRKRRFVLATLYYATNMVASPFIPEPNHWRSARNWLTATPTCDWRGINCNEQDEIIRINMERNQMTGALPVEIIMIGDTLNTLDLTSNQIWMQGDAYNIFEKLPNLEHLYMDDNYLVHDEGLPPQIGELKKLERLRLSYNLLGGQLEGQYPILNGMTKLTHLELESNFFNGTFPESIGNLQQLVYIYMRRNDFEFNLDWLKGGRLTNLFSLWLEGPRLKGTIPEDIGLLTRLASLSLTDSKLTGTIPTSIGELTGLRRLWLYGNELHGQFPDSMNNLPLLELAEFHNNKLWGQMPENICNAVAINNYEYKSLTSDCLDPNAVRCDNTTCCTECY